MAPPPPPSCLAPDLVRRSIREPRPSGDAGPAAPGTAWHPDLFNTTAYAALHARHPARVHITLPRRAIFHAMPLGEGRYASPARAPYGGFDADPALDEDAFTAFVADCEHALRHAGATSIGIALPPLCHGPHLVRRLPTLCRRGWRVTRQELNQSVPITPTPFPAQTAQATRKRIAKALRAGVTARLLPPPDHESAYDAIADNRRKKGRAMSMSWPDVQAMAAAFPAQTHIFGAMHEGRIIAAAICIAANPRILYVHAWGEREGAEPLSPVSLLAAEIHAFASANAFTLMDLGTSSVHGIADPGLVAFKRSLGATPSLKLWLARDLA